MNRALFARGGSWADHSDEDAQAAAAAGPRQPPGPPPAHVLSPRAPSELSEYVPLGTIWKLLF